MNKPLVPCPRCDEPCELTRHHVFPKRFRDYWTGKQRRELVCVCRKCHDAIEAAIAAEERASKGPLSPLQYLELAGVTVTKAA